MLLKFSLGVNFINILRALSTIYLHQKLKSQNVIRDKLFKSHLYEKLSRKMLMKFLPDVAGRRRKWISASGVVDSRNEHFETVAGVKSFRTSENNFSDCLLIHFFTFTYRVSCNFIANWDNSKNWIKSKIKFVKISYGAIKVNTC